MRLPVGSRCPYCTQIVPEPDSLPVLAYAGGGVSPEAGVGAPLEADTHAAPARHIARAESTDREAVVGIRAAAYSALAPIADGTPSLFDAQPSPSAPSATGATPGPGGFFAARLTDPITSLEAALSVERGKAREDYARVLDLLAAHGPLSDFDLARMTGTKQTSIGKRRGELRDAGLVVEHDRAGVSDTGSPCLRWALAAKEEAA